METTVDIAIIGAGAAGLFAAIWAGRTHRGSIIALDGAKKLGAKVLVAGGGRCNVTHHQVDELQYAGSSRNSIKKVLRRFDVPETVAFFRERGVELKKEDTGKLFPVTDDAHTVLNALLAAAEDAHVELMYPWRVGGVKRDGEGFVIERAGALTLSGLEDSATSPAGSGGVGIRARKIILATGGMALPKSGSDGLGYAIARSLGHTITPRVFPALVPLILADSHFIRSLSGITLPTTLELRSATGKRLKTFTNSTLLTHFGLSGPGPLDMSRYFTAAHAEDAGARLVLSWLPGESIESVDLALQKLGKVSPARWLRERGLAERVADAICKEAGVDPSVQGQLLPRDHRKNLAQMVVATPLPVVGDRGFTHAEVTAGGIPLNEITLDTMESRVCPGLYLCGEICDVDGRIGGFNFQWAWSSGYIAGTSAGRAEQN
ncbi:MAG: aminoacetone oxidase family FAD-binding enzyme [Planctomycetota bacterium]